MAIFLDDQIIVLDEQSNKLLRFSSEGKFLGTIGAGGRGPGEYVRVTQLEVNQLNKTIYVFDISQGKVLKFNLDGGPGFWPLGKINDRVLYSAVTLDHSENPVLMVVEMK